MLNQVKIATQRLAEHPFSSVARAGELTKQALISWILCAGKESQIFPNVIRGALRRANDSLSAVLEKNLADELGNGVSLGSHFEHYLELLDDIGVAREEFFMFQPGFALEKALNIARELSDGESLPRLYGYLLINESATGPLYGAIEVSARKRFPQMRSQFFQLHVEGDEIHVNDLISAIEVFNEEDLPAIEDGINLGELGLRLVLDEANARAACTEI